LAGLVHGSPRETVNDPIVTWTVEPDDQAVASL